MNNKKDRCLVTEWLAAVFLHIWLYFPFCCLYNKKYAEMNKHFLQGREIKCEIGRNGWQQDAWRQC